MYFVLLIIASGSFVDITFLECQTRFFLLIAKSNQDNAFVYCCCGAQVAKVVLKNLQQVDVSIRTGCRLQVLVRNPELSGNK